MKALIQGAGISGLACARVLDERGWDVTIVEAATAPRTGGYMIDFFGPGWEAAARLGVIDEIRRRGHDYRRLVTRDASGRVTARIGLDLVRAAARGRFTSILREDVELSLRAGLPARIDQRFGVSVAELTRRRSGVEATLTDGTGIEADLVLGCDGLSSGSAASCSVRPTSSCWISATGSAVGTSTRRASAAGWAGTCSSPT